MEALQSLRPPMTSRLRHSVRHSREQPEQDSQTKNRAGSLHTSGHFDEITKASLAALGRGPTPRPKEENDEFIQSWLQQMQARHSHLSRPDHERRQLRLTEQSSARDHVGKHRKRPRPILESSPPSPEAAERVENRFEKRTRHKTRDDKYDYKPHADKKRASGQGLRSCTTTDARKDRALAVEGKRSARQGDAQAAASHMLPRTSKLIPKANRISRHRNLTRKNSEPNASKLKLSKSQKEDKELEEFSAFFSRRMPHDKPESRSYGVADRAGQFHGFPPDADSHPHSSRHHGHRSPHSSQRRYGSVSVDEGEVVPQYSSSLPAIRGRDSGTVRSRRPPDKAKSVSAWSQHHDDCGMDKLQSHYFREDPSIRQSIATFERDRLQLRRKYGPRLSREPTRLSPDSAQEGTRGARKDAAAQTDLSPKPRSDSLEHRERPDEGWVTRDVAAESQRPYSTGLSLDAFTQNARRLSTGREVEGELLSVPQFSRVAMHVEPHLEPRQLSRSCGFDDDWAAAGARSQERRYTFIDQPTYISAPTRPVSFGYGRERDEGPLLHLYARPAEQTATADRYLGSESQLPQYDDGKSIPGNFGFENLEEFIRRIESEAALPVGQPEDDEALPLSEFGRPNWREQRPLGPCDVANLDGVDDAAILAGRSRPQMEADLFLHDSAGRSAPSF